MPQPSKVKRDAREMREDCTLLDYTLLDCTLLDAPVALHADKLSIWNFNWKKTTGSSWPMGKLQRPSAWSKQRLHVFEATTHCSTTHCSKHPAATRHLLTVIHIHGPACKHLATRPHSRPKARVGCNSHTQLRRCVQQLQTSSNNTPTAHVQPPTRSTQSGQQLRRQEQVCAQRNHKR